MPSRMIIDDFLQQKRIAVVGVSRKSQGFSNAVFRLFREKGYDVIPVNPNAAEAEGVRCYPSVQAVPVPVDGVVVMTPAARSLAVVQDCHAAGVRRVWLHRGAGPGAVSPEAVAYARNAGMAVVDGACPFMFLGGWLHKIHGLFVRLEA